MGDATISYGFRNDFLTHWMVVEPWNKVEILKISWPPIFFSCLLSFSNFFASFIDQEEKASKITWGKIEKQKKESDSKQQLKLPETLLPKHEYTLKITPLHECLIKQRHNKHTHKKEQYNQQKIHSFIFKNLCF